MNLIHGVEVKDLKIRSDERGMLAEILRSDEGLFKRFGQVYFTTAYPGVVKAWHYHKLQWDLFTCIHGEVKLALADLRGDSPTKGAVNEFFVGIRNPKLIAIPPDVYHGFKCIGAEEAIMINVPTEPYRASQPDEYREAWNWDRIPYDWDRKNG